MSPASKRKSTYAPAVLSVPDVSTNEYSKFPPYYLLFLNRILSIIAKFYMIQLSAVANSVI